MNLRTYSALIFAFLLLSLSLLPLASAKEQDDHAVLLPESAAKDLRTLCSRDSPKVEGTWTPSPEIIATMESHLDKLANTRGKRGPLDRQIKDPRTSFRQYIGILTGGQRYIYINGSCEKLHSDWHHRLQDVCDGGGCFWGVLYNVQTGEFSDLEMNGVA